MELYQLKGFVAVAESGHLTRAADKLHVSQPALSAQVKAVEDELGVTLFERTPSGMALSPAGRKLLPHAQAVLAAAQALRNAAHAIEGELAGQVKVGTVADPNFVRLPQFLARAVERHPLVEIMLQHEVSGEAFDKVRDDALDASFYYGDRTHPHVANLVERLPRDLVLQHDLEQRMALDGARQELRQPHEIGIGNRADLHLAGELAFDGMRGIAQALRRRQHALCVRQQLATRRRQRHARGRALEQRHTELVLDGLDLCRQGWLADVELVGGAGEMAGLRHRDEALQLVELHKPLYCIRNAAPQ